MTTTQRPAQTTDNIYLAPLMARFHSLVQSYAGYEATGVVVFCHLVLAAIVFSPYFLYNYVLLANSDVPDFNVPMFILARKAVWTGHLNLWNPYLLNGVSNLLSAVVPIYGVINPANWLLFLVPEKYLLLAGTFQSFVNLWLVGVVAYLFFREELKSCKWAFFASAIYQLCNYTLWWSWAFDLSSLLLWFTIALYLIWTAHNRRAYLNYILLTLILTVLLIPSYPVVTVNMLIILSVMALYRFLSQFATFSCWHHLFTSAGAIITSSLIFILRLLPTWFEASQTSRAQGFTADFRDISFLGLRLFNPEVFGVDNHASYQLLGATRLGEAFDSEFHIHGYFPQFFGVVVALLLVWAIVTSKKQQQGAFWFWLGYVLVSFSIIVGLEPFDTIFRVLIFPVYRIIGLQIYLPLGVCVLAGLTAKTLEDNNPEDWITSRSLSLFTGICFVILAYILSIWLLQYPDATNLVRLGLIAMAALVIFAWLGQNWQLFPKQKLFSLLEYSTLVCLIGLCLYFTFFATDFNQTFVSHLRIISTSLLLLLLIYLGTRLEVRTFWGFSAYLIGQIILFIITFSLIVVLYPSVTAFREWLLPEHIWRLALLGTLRFVIVTLSFVAVLRLLQQRKFRQEWLFPVFFLLLLFDILPTGKIYSFLLSTPFYKNPILFPSDRLNVVGVDGFPLELDTKNYRVNQASAMLGLPYGLELYGPGTYLMAGSVVYGLRTYDGYFNGVPNRYRQFALNWATPGIASYSHGIYTITNDRFLNLSGVRYDYNLESKTVKIRPNALSRFMLFTEYEVIPNDKTSLQRLKDPAFAPLKTVILDQEPSVPSDLSGQPGQKLDFVEHSTDDIELNISTKTPGIVFFNDNYHPDWHVFVNGLEQPVLHADYDFMAASVPAGQNQVVFRYQPRFFYYGLYASEAGVILFLLTVATLYIFKNRLDSALTPVVMKPRNFNGILDHFLRFKLAYLGFIFLLVVAVFQALFNYHQSTDIFYKDFHIVNYQSRYYVLPRTMWPMDVANGIKLSLCYKNGQCTITTSSEEARQFVDQPVEQRLPSIVEGEFQGFNVLHYQQRFYAVPQSPWLFNLLDLKSWEKCRLANHCAVDDTLEGVKMQISSLTPLAENRLSSLLKSVTTPSTYPLVLGERLFDWHSDQWVEFPSQLDLTFRQPVKLEELGFHLKVDRGKNQPKQHQIMIMAGKDSENLEYKISLTLDLNKVKDTIIVKLPDSPIKYQYYQIHFTSTKGQERPLWLTIQSTHLYVLVEENYRSFNIHWDGNNYYVLKQSLEPLDVTNHDNFNQCSQNSQCAIAATLEEAKQLVDQFTLQ